MARTSGSTNKKQRIFAVYNNDDEIVIAGNREECMIFLNIDKENTFYNAVRKENLVNREYRIYAVGKEEIYKVIK